jgi:hypothetical protein
MTFAKRKASKEGMFSAQGFFSVSAHIAAYPVAVKMDYIRIGGPDHLADCFNEGVVTLAEAFEHVSGPVSSKSVAMVILFSKIGPILTVLHEVRVVVLLDHLNLLVSRLLDFLNEVLRDNIWRWELSCRKFLENFCTRSSGNGKLQGLGVRFELLQRSVQLTLNLVFVVAKIV